MDKGQQIKPRKDKKKNTQTGILMGQNTNVFSQLSATYLQNKDNYTTQEQQFIKATQTIEYHDPNINRIIALLRKKADVTKVKAAQELKQQLFKMSPQVLQQFMPTFSQLFMETIINEQSKQVTDEFVIMLNQIIANHKKIVIKQISTFYGPMLIINRSNNINTLKTQSSLFNGSDQEIYQKSIILLLKKQVKKKFLIFCRLIAECEQVHKLGQQNYQRNCASLMKVLKQLINIFLLLNQKKQEQIVQFQNFIDQICQIVDPQSKIIEQYFKIGGKAKAALLEYYQSLIKLAIQFPNWEIEWEKYAKCICQNFLDKDVLTQQALWKHCNTQLIHHLLSLEKQDKEPYSLFIKFLPKPQQKVGSVLKIGGASLYKQLPNYFTIFPYTCFSTDQKNKQTHKSIINKISFIRKFMANLLDLQDQNEVRMQCYYLLTKYFINTTRKVYQNIEKLQLDQKKEAQIKQLFTKTSKELIQNLQYRYYKNPPTSRNSFTYSVPSYFCKLLTEIEPQFDFKFDTEQTFNLYNNLAKVQNEQANEQYLHQLFDKIYNKCKQQNKLLLGYLQNFPSKNLIGLDMTDKNQDVETTAKLFLLSKQADDQKNWFDENWDWKIKAIVYDPRITINDLASLDLERHQLYFSPTYKHVNKIYDNQKYDSIRIKFFIDCLVDNDSVQIVPILLPLLKEKLMPRNKTNIINQLLQLFSKSADHLAQKKWMVGAEEVLRLLITFDVLCQSLMNDDNYDQLNKQNLQKFLQSSCLFAFTIHSYRLEKDSEQLLKYISKLNMIPSNDVSVPLFQSVRKTIKEAYNTFNKVQQKVQNKQRRNRLNRCLNFIQKLTWNCVGTKQSNKQIRLLEDILQIKQIIKQADLKPDFWELSQIILSNMEQGAFHKFSKKIIEQTLNLSENQNEDKIEWDVLLSLISCCQIILPLQRHAQAKKVFVLLQNKLFSYVDQSCSAQEKIKILRIVVDRACNDSTMTLIHGAKTLLKQFLKKYQEMSQQNLQSILEICLINPTSKLYSDQRNENQIQRNTLLIISLSSQIPLLDLQNIEQIYEDIFEKSNKQKGILYLSLVTILAEIQQGGVGLEKISEEYATQTLNNSIKIFKQLQTVQCKAHTQNFYRYSMLGILINLYAMKGSKIFQPHWTTIIDDLIWAKIQQGSPLHGAIQSSRYKFISKIFSTLDLPLKKQIMNMIPKQILKELNYYGELLDQIQQDETEIQNKQHYENVINIFIQSAEVLMKIAQNLSPEAHPDQQIVIGLLQCPFPGVKRTSFILLKQMYELKLVEKKPPKLFSQYLALDQQTTQFELNSVIANTISKYLYSWQALINRRSATERLTEEQYNLTLEDYLQQSQDQFHEQFLRNVFDILDKQLLYLNNQNQYQEVLSAEQLSSEDMLVIFEDQLNVPQKIYRLSMKTLFMFILNFPLFLRDFMDKNKKYKNLCDRLLRNVISDAIFKQQITKIQIREPEWKAGGNFQIFVTPKNKEIYAEYTHDVIRIGLRLIMRNNYPLTPIAIQFGEGLKIDEGSRWGLMLQSQLHSRNNTIINGILLWKQNIDKKLAGVDQCAICFDIVNASGQLPKKACKTCKKKFHGNCVMKWFNKSNKSECPLCKSQFL